VSKERYLRKLNEALAALKISGEAYDRGIDGEAIRLAGTLRVMFHANKRTQCVPLVEHLGIQEWEMLSSDAQHGDPMGFVSIKLDLASSTPVKAFPKLGDQFFPISISHWWLSQPIYRFQGREYFRCSLVRAAANKDGASHVDVSLDKFYEDMESGGKLLVLNGQNLVYPNLQAPYDQTKPQHCRNVHLAMLRQFSHEVLATASRYQWIKKLSTP
jgi:hypothetical protein